MGEQLVVHNRKVAGFPVVMAALMLFSAAHVAQAAEIRIVATVNEVRKKFDYVFTTGGIGPTHDDITADCIAKAFGVGISEHPEAVARMTKHYGDVALFTPARRRMARVVGFDVPDGSGGLLHRREGQHAQARWDGGAEPRVFDHDRSTRRQITSRSAAEPARTAFHVAVLRDAPFAL